MIEQIIDFVLELIPFLGLVLSAVAIITTAREKSRQSRIEKSRQELEEKRQVDEKKLSDAQADDIYSQINQRIQAQYENLVISLNEAIEDLQRQAKIKDHEISALQDQMFMMRESFRRDLQLYKQYINYMLKFIEDHVTDGCVPLDLEHFNPDGTAEFAPANT